MMNDELKPQFDLRPAEIPTPLTFSEGGRKFRVTHIFRAPEFADWLEYEQKLQRSAEIVGGATRFDRREAEAAEALWDRIALRIERYKIPNPQIAQITQNEEESAASAKSVDLLLGFPDGWREKVDVFHKAASVRLLAQVYVAEPEAAEAAEAEYLFDPDRVEVRLVAGRGGQEYDGLVHILRRPTARQQKEFSRTVSSALYVRGSRTEKSLLPSRLREMVQFYDELILELRGYVVNGAPAAREDAVKWMDALHKQTAVSALFSFDESAPSAQSAD